MKEITEKIWQAILDYLPNIISACLVFLIGWLLKKLIMRIVKRVMDRHAEKLVNTFARRAIDITLWVFLLFAVAAALGLNTASLVTALGAAGVAIGLALQGSLSNVASGILLLGSKVFRVGDYVEINGTEGTVFDTDLMFTHLDTADNKRIAVPNSAITVNNIINYTFNKIRRIDILVPLSYGQDVDSARAALSEICQSANILESPAYAVKVKQFDASAVNMLVRVWCAKEDYWDVYFYIHEQIKKRAEQAQLQIPFEQLDVHFYPPVADEKKDG